MALSLNKATFYKAIEYTLAIVLLFFLTRQVPFMRFTFLMNLALAGIFILFFFKIIKRIVALPDYLKILLLLLESLIFANAAYSFFVQQNSLSLVIRFFLILQFVIFAYFIYLDKKFISFFLFFEVLQCLFLIGLYLILLLKFNIHTYLPVRFFFLHHQWGDVYTFNGYFYRVQVKGNDLIPVAFFITFAAKDLKYKKLYQAILLIGLVIAGNFAYLAATGFFLLSYYLLCVHNVRKFSQRVLIIIILSLLAILPLFNYISGVIERKEDKSLATRGDQVEVLWNDLAENKINLLWGKGLGNTISEVTEYRDYTGKYYYELQVLYIFNQLGLIFLVFLIFNTLMSIYNYKTSRVCILIYLSYLVYSITNPYILNTSQVIVILLLNILSGTEFKKRLYLDKQNALLCMG